MGVEQVRSVRGVRLASLLPPPTVRWPDSTLVEWCRSSRSHNIHGKRRPQRRWGRTPLALFEFVSGSRVEEEGEAKLREKTSTTNWMSGICSGRLPNWVASYARPSQRRSSGRSSLGPPRLPCVVSSLTGFHSFTSLSSTAPLSGDLEVPSLKCLVVSVLTGTQIRILRS